MFMLSDKFYMHIPKYFLNDFEIFKQKTKGKTARVICVLIKDFNNKNIRLHIPTIRYILENNPKQIKYLRELLDEFS